MLETAHAPAPTIPTSLHEFIQSLRNALRDEISSRQTPHQGKPFSVPLSDGRVLDRRGRHQRVVFRTASLPLQGYLDDTQGELIIEGRPHPCMILGLTVDQLTLSLVAELQDHIPQARLTIDRMRLLLALDKRLAAIQAHPQDYLTDLALKCFTPSAVPQRIAQPVPIAHDPSLNPEQYAALVRALCHDFLYLWGPPGTGKTKVIGAVTKLSLERGDRILICSNTNTAVDQALEAVLADSAPARGSVLRYGLSADDAPAHLAPVTMDALAADEMKTLTTQLEGLQAKHVPLAQETAALEQLVRLQEDLTTLDQQYAGLHQQETRLERSLADAQAQLAPAESAVEALEDELQRYWAAPRWRRLFLRSLVHIQADLFAARVLVDDARESVETLTAQRQTLATTAADVLTTRRFLTHSLSSQLGGRSFEALPEQLADAQARALALHHQISACQRAIATVEHRLIQGARVVATTITRTYTAAILDRERFDLVIIDEGSMATPPALFTALCLAKRQVIIVGDFLQLPPIAESRTTQAKQWLANDIYHLAGIRNDQDPRIAALTTQYRMHPDIAALAARLYQRAGLAYRTDTQIRHARQPLVELAPVPGKALAFIDSSDAQPWVEKDQKGSPSNAYHAKVALALVREAFANPTCRPSVSLIAPYRHQVRLLQDLMHREPFADHVRIGTIHSFQGQQSDIVIFDTTVTGDLTRTMLGRCDQDQAPCKLMNVAFTRGKSKLLVIGHSPSVATLAQTPNSLLWEALQIAVDQQVVIPSRRFLHPQDAPVESVNRPLSPPTAPQPPDPPRRTPRLYRIR